MARVRKLRGPGFPEIKRRLSAMPTTVAAEVASEVAPDLTRRTQQAYSSGRTVYGNPRPPHPSTGRVPDLVRTGKTKDQLKFRAVGTTTEARLAGRHVKYLIGWFKIMPVGSAALPRSWAQAIDAIARRVLSKRAEGIAA